MDPIRSTYEDDPDMLAIVREFVAELPDRARSLEVVLDAQDLGELQRLAHQLKGAGGGYGFPIVTERAAALESAVKRGTAAASVKEACASLCETLRAVVVPEEK